MDACVEGSEWISPNRRLSGVRESPGAGNKSGVVPSFTLPGYRSVRAGCEGRFLAVSSNLES